jgi:hypothetical protein
MEERGRLPLHADAEAGGDGDRCADDEEIGLREREEAAIAVPEGQPVHGDPARLADPQQQVLSTNRSPSGAGR